MICEIYNFGMVISLSPHHHSIGDSTMFLHFGTPKSLGQLVTTPISISSARSKLKILVIDDQPFIIKDVLASHGYAIHEMRDISAIDLVAGYPIVVCDIKGIGATFHSKHEGAHLFREIRRAFPEKYIIAFSGFRFDATYNEYFRVADVSLKKDTDTEAWVKVLDEAISIMSDSKFRWLRMRRFLLEEARLELWTVLQIETAFIDSVSARDKDKLLSPIKGLRLPDETRQMLISFAGSLFTDVVSGLITAAIAP
jgi:DNA-binding NarL/FixJ family response regulator